MITPSFFTTPNAPGKTPAVEIPAKRETPARRGTSPADHLMYAWSMTTTNSSTTRAADHIEIRATREECPPEVYLG